MTASPILIFSGSTRAGSFTNLLAQTVARLVDARGGKATLVDLAHYPMDFVDAGNSGGAMPQPVEALHELFSAHKGIFIITPEYNAFPPPLLLNALDWLSRVRHYEGGMVEAFEQPLFALGAASPSPIGGYRALMALRQKLELGLGATVIPSMIAIASAFKAFDADGNLLSDTDQTGAAKTVDQLLARLHG